MLEAQEIGGTRGIHRGRGTSHGLEECHLLQLIRDVVSSEDHPAFVLALGVIRWQLCSFFNADLEQAAKVCFGIGAFGFSSDVA